MQLYVLTSFDAFVISSKNYVCRVKIVPEMTYKVSSGTLKLCSLTCPLQNLLRHFGVHQNTPLLPSQFHLSVLSVCNTSDPHQNGSRYQNEFCTVYYPVV